MSCLILTKSKAQVLLDPSTDRVSMPKITYKAIREGLLTRDTLISNQKQIIAYKDSIIKNDSLKFKSFQSELDDKNKAIDTLATGYKTLEENYKKEKSSLLTNFKLWLGLTGGLVFGVLIAN